MGTGVVPRAKARWIGRRYALCRESDGAALKVGTHQQTFGGIKSVGVTPGLLKLIMDSAKEAEYRPLRGGGGKAVYESGQ